MAKYIDAEMFKQIVIDAGNKNNTPSLGEFIANLVDIFPAADVAPRAEVAREIFEELDKIMLPILHEVSQVYIYAKLKKKYTEEEK
jgi:hypothetical protein